MVLLLVAGVTAAVVDLSKIGARAIDRRRALRACKRGWDWAAFERELASYASTRRAPRRASAALIRPGRPGAAAAAGSARDGPDVSRRARISPRGSCWSSRGGRRLDAATRTWCSAIARPSSSPSASARLASSWAMRILRLTLGGRRGRPPRAAREAVPRLGEGDEVRAPAGAVRGEHRADAAVAVGVGAHEDPLAGEHARRASPRAWRGACSRSRGAGARSGCLRGGAFA